MLAQKNCMYNQYYLQIFMTRDKQWSLNVSKADRMTKAFRSSES